MYEAAEKRVCDIIGSRCDSLSLAEPALAEQTDDARLMVSTLAKILHEVASS